MKKFITIFGLATTLFLASCGCDGNCKNCTDPNCKHKQAANAANAGKNDTTAAAIAGVYDCPMHCEGAKSDKASKCPKCGMDTELQTK